MVTFKEAFEYAKQNPNSSYAQELQRRIAAGQFEEEMKSLGAPNDSLKSKEGVGGIGGFVTGALKGVAQTLTSVPRKVGEIFEIGAKKKQLAGTQEALAGTQDITDKLISELGNLKQNDPNRETLINIIKENISRQIKTKETLPKDLTSKTKEIFSPLEARGTAEQAGFAVEKIAEFLIPGNAVLKTEQTLLKGGKALGALAEAGELNLAGRIAERVSRPLTALGEARKAGELNLLGRATESTARNLTRAAIEGGSGAIVSAAQGGDFNQIKTTALVNAAFPIAGATLSAGKNIVKEALGKTGQKIQWSIIRPSAADVADGFNIKNVTKYNVGGSLGQIVAKTETRLNQLGMELKKRLKAADGEINLSSVYRKTVEKLKSGKETSFGDNKAVERVLGSLKDEIKSVAPKWKSDLLQANLIKRGAGKKGAWAFGRIEPDANAVENVYSTFYRILKEEIEKTAPQGIKDINKQISELIPISNAAIRRLPVEQRNNVLSLTDTMGLYAAAFDPHALLIIGAKKLSRSGKFAELLVKASERQPSRGVTRQRVFGATNQNP